MTHLNSKVLPNRCIAEAQVHVGGRVEIDAGTFDIDDGPLTSSNGAGGVATQPWAPPQATLTIPAIFPDEIEVQVFYQEGGYELVGAIELVSPGNKDRADAVDSFTAKCVTYLRQGVGLLVVDIVTARLKNMHSELMSRLCQADSASLLSASSPYCVSYWPHRTTDGDIIEIWPQPLMVGRSLPLMPLGLRRLPTIPIDLDTTYSSACEACRL